MTVAGQEVTVYTVVVNTVEVEYCVVVAAPPLPVAVEVTLAGKLLVPDETEVTVPPETDVTVGVPLEELVGTTLPLTTDVEVG